jgi:hypothetical protein
MSDMQDEDARNLGAFYARKIRRMVGQALTVESLLGPMADVVLHAYAIDSQPPVDTLAFIKAFKEGFTEAFKETV